MTKRCKTDQRNASLLFCWAKATTIEAVKWDQPSHIHFICKGWQIIQKQVQRLLKWVKMLVLFRSSKKWAAVVLEIIPRTFVQLSWLKIKSTTERKGIYQPASGIRCYSTCSHRSPLRLFVNTREHWKENLHRKYLWASNVFPKTADLFVSQTHLSLTKPTLRSQKAFKPIPPFNADAEWLLLHTLWNSHVEVKINVGPNIYIFFKHGNPIHA